ncbi:hypothetical protein PVL29_024201 [Vitis rotundifolia]|uniref:Uncharacterized protein n=1 Tax=Vitis rotundifolia TaxID=103349 RepID=A0AA38YR52_VITRO|nr:hypothetical protein PVL29_024201 [Vitis rotundifolia]
MLLTIGGKRLKLTIWDTAGQERFGTLTNTYYRVYDVTRQETFTNLSDVWEKEVELYSTNHECIDFFVGNKVDRDSERDVTREGMSLAQEHNAHFLNVVLKLERMYTASTWSIGTRIRSAEKTNIVSERIIPGTLLQLLLLIKML